MAICKITLLGLVGSLFLVAGCAKPSGNSLIVVKGTVTLDGVPLTSGKIVFIPIPNQKGLPPASATISGGSFTGKTLAGKMRVEIRSPQPVPGTKNTTGEPLNEEIIPESYNVQSALTVDVSPTEPNDFKFALVR